MANGQLWEIDSQGNKKIISGLVTGELPKYTMAEYTALTNKPQYWICTDYDATSEYGINDTEVKHGNTTVNAVLNKVTPISLGGIANNETKTLTIPDEILEGGGIYLLSFLNSYGAGGVYLLKRNTSTGSIVITSLSASQYLTLTSVDSKSLTVTASGLVVLDTHILRI